MHWILSFEEVPAIPKRLPELDLLLLVDQITENDCLQACKLKAKCRSDKFKSMLMFDQKDDFCKTTYKIVRSKQADPLQEVPTQWSFQAVLLRSKIGSIALKIDQFRAIRPFAELRFGEAKIQFVKQVGDRVFFKHLEGIVPVRGTLTASFTADTVDEIASEFADFWTPMWLRTSVKSNFQLKHGAILKKFLHMRIYRKYHLFNIRLMTSISG